MEELLIYINNFYYLDKEFGTFTIKDGIINTKNKYLKGQWIEIEGSFLNDGIYKIEDISENGIKLTGLTDEEFKGIIFILKIPKTLQDIKTEVEEFNAKNIATNKISYSFGGYSESLATNEKGNVQNWKDVFRNRLIGFRNITSRDWQKRRILR